MFEYEEKAGHDHMLVLRTARGAVIKTGFNGFDAETVYFGESENGFDVNSDDLNDVFVDISKSPKDFYIRSIQDIIQMANRDIEEIVAEVEQEAADKKAHENEMMSQERFI